MKSQSRQAQLAKNTVILTVGRICTQCISFFLLPLYTAILDPSDYGIVDLVSTYVALIMPICNWQMDMGLFRYMLDVRNDPNQQKRMVSSVTNLNHFQTAVFLGLYFVIQFFVHSEYKIFLAIEVCLNIYNMTMMQTSRGLGRNDIYSVASFISASSLVGLNVLFIAVLRMGALGLFYGSILSKMLTNLYLYIALRYWKYYSVRIFDRRLLKEIIRYSLPLIPNQLAWWVVGASDRVVVSHVLGVAQNGIFTVASKFSTMYITFYNIFNLAWTESCAIHINDDDGENYLSDVISTMFSLFSAICIGIIACMPFLFPLLINESYQAAYPQIPILMYAVLCQSVVGLVSVVYTAKKMSSVLAKTSFWIALINLSADLLLIRFVGLYAASFSTLVAYGAMVIYRCYDVQKYVHITIPKIKLVKAFALAVAVGVAYYSRNWLLQAVALAAAIVYSLVENKVFLLGILQGIIEKFRAIIDKNHIR